MREIYVRFESGKEFFGAYWGYLSGGGLIIADRHGLSEGELVTLCVHIVSTDSRYRLIGRVVKRQSALGQVVVAFRRGEPHDMLVTSALAEAEKVPPRRHPRRRVRVPVEVVAVPGEMARAPGRLLNMSLGGCCLELEEAAMEGFGPGTPVVVRAPGLELRGEVVWGHHGERGIEFEKLEAARRGALESYLQDL